MSDEKLSPERAVRLLRAIGGKLEHTVRCAYDGPEASPELPAVTYRLAVDVAADIALIAQLLADHIEGGC